jgi:hypothetical protein
MDGPGFFSLSYTFPNPILTELRKQEGVRSTHKWRGAGPLPQFSRILEYSPSPIYLGARP